MREAATRHKAFLVVGVCALFGGIGADGCPPNPPTETHTRVLAVNDLGMHCMDREYATFSILPPFNVLQAQVVQRAGNGTPRVLGPDEVTLSYEAVADASGSINSTSLDGKTGFWDHVEGLFGFSLPTGQGILGQWMPEDAPVPGPQPIPFDAGAGHFKAAGIPITPIDDAQQHNFYPLLRLVARDATSGDELAHLDIVTPVSDETDCQTCHRTGELAADDPAITWSNHPDPERQAKLNVLILHDHDEGTDLVASQPVLCAECHYSAALDLTGSGPPNDLPTSSAVMHDFHGRQLEVDGTPVFPPNGSADDTCYKCHPGAITRCYRGVMATAGFECRDCHGDMLATGGAYPLLAGGSLDGSNDGAPRRPWIDVPRCQACHTGDARSRLSGADLVEAGDGIRLAQTWRVGDPSASPLLAINLRFAENPGTHYRDSVGHGGLLCTACHGSPHAEWPNADPAANDNVAAVSLQGHAGPIIECDTCHAAGTLRRTLDGPHGMHVVGDLSFVKEGHHEVVEGNRNACRACHGLDGEGTVLSRTATDRVFRIEDDQTVVLAKGTPVRCDHCHSNEL